MDRLDDVIRTIKDQEAAGIAKASEYLHAHKILRKKEEEETTKECPFCQEKISIKATRCPHCTSELN